MVMATNPEGLMHEHLAVLRECALRVLAKGEQLWPTEDDDCERRRKKFFAIGSSLGLTPEELVHMILHDVLVPSSKCGGSCRGQIIETGKEG